MRNRRDLKKKLWTKYFPVNLDDNKFWWSKRCSVYIRSELKFTPHEKNSVCVPWWTILQMEVTLKKWVLVGEGGDFIPPPSTTLPTPC